MTVSCWSVGGRQVHRGLSAGELGEVEAELVGLADVGERAEQAGEVGEVAVVREPGDHLQFAVGGVLDGLDR